jgi:hypothetical protein
LRVEGRFAAAFGLDAADFAADLDDAFVFVLEEVRAFPVVVAFDAADLARVVA